MKKFFILIIVFSFSFFLKAQERKNEISIGIGFGSVGNFTAGFDFTKPKNSKTQFPLIFINYKRSLSKIFDIKAFLAYEQYSSTSVFNKIKTFYQPTTAIEGNFNYIKKEIFQLYSGLGVGARIENQKIKSEVNSLEKETKIFPAIQIIALGIRYGEKFGINSEIGFGYKGIFNLGLSYRF